MMNPFKMLSDINQMRKHAAQIQQALEAKELTVTSGNITIVITGNQNVKRVEVNGVADENLRRAFNDAIKQSQQVAAGQLAELSKSLNMPGQ